MNSHPNTGSVGGSNNDPNPPAAGVDLSGRPVQVLVGARVPTNYEVWENGVFQIKPPAQRVALPSGTPIPTPSLTRRCPNFWRENLTLVTRQPILLVGFGQTIDTKERLAEIWFMSEDSTPTRIWVDRTDLAFKRQLTQLAAHGFVINELNANDIMLFLSDCVLANKALTRRVLARRCGWHEYEDRKGWLLGETWIGTDDAILPDPRGGNSYRNAYTQEGDLTYWKTTTWPLIQQIRQLRFLMGSTFASPLVRQLGWRPHVIHHFGGTTGGKTAWAKLAMSAWGCPSALHRTLNTTEVAMEAVFRDVDDFPLLWDEQQGATVDLTRMIYNVASGQGRSRADRSGTIQQERQQWHSIIRTTGEQKVTGVGKTDLGGQDTRCVQVEHAGASAAMSSAGTTIYNFLNEGHHGVVGAWFLRQLYDYILAPGKISQLKADYWELAREQITEAILDKFPGVLAGQIYVRAGHLATTCIGEWLMLWWVYGLNRQEAWDSAVADMLEVGMTTIDPDNFSPLWQRTAVFLRQYLKGSGHRLIDLSDTSGWEEAKRRRRQNDIVGYKTPKEIWFLPHFIDQVLLREQLPPERVWPELAAQGILQKYAGDRHLKIHRSLASAGLKREKFYVLDIEKLQAGEKDDPTEVLTDEPEVDMEIDEDGYVQIEVGGTYRDPNLGRRLDL